MAPRKRAHDEVDEEPRDTPQRDLKQPKTDAAAQAAAESNSESSYVSAAAAVFSEGEDDSASSQSSHDDLESELSTSSEEPSSDEPDSEEEAEGGESEVEDARTEVEGEAEITNVRPGSKPNISKEGADGRLLHRLRRFLPEMQEANEQLDREREAGTLGARDIEACEDDEPHIEMNLGLGVLEDKEKGGDGEDGEDDDMSDDSGDQRDVMQRLMGDPELIQKGRHIQEVGDG